MSSTATFQPDKFYALNGVQILGLGRVTDMSGKQIDITDELCESIASRYNPNPGPGGYEARVSLDHEKKGRAYARIPRVYHVKGEGLFGDYADVPGSVAPDFLHSGGFANRSAEIIDYAGGPYLGTVSHLGAQRPAIKWMRPILPSQAVEQDSFGEPGEVNGNGMWLFSEEQREESPEEKPNDMASETDTQLAERLGAAETQLAEEARKNKELETKLAEADRRDAARLAELKFSEAQAESLKFAESESIRPRLGGNDADAVAKVIAHAKLNCPDIDGVNFGEALEQVFERLPDGPPLGKAKPLEGKPEGNDKSELKFSEAVQSGLDDLKEKYGEDSKAYKAAFAAAEAAVAQLTEAN